MELLFFRFESKRPEYPLYNIKRGNDDKKGVARATGVMRFSIEFYKRWPPLDFHDFCLSATALSRILLALLL